MSVGESVEGGEDKREGFSCYLLFGEFVNGRKWQTVVLCDRDEERGP